jgi:serine/threonine protein kinase
MKDHVPCLVKAETEGKYPFLALEFVNGSQTLETFLKSGGEFNHSVITQLIYLVERLHFHEIIHRDFTPRNILVLKNYKLVLIDFAFAVWRINSSEISSKRRKEITILRTLGDGFKPTPFCWDDAYSLSQILVSNLKDSILKDYRKKISALVGKHIFYLKVKD